MIFRKNPKIEKANKEDPLEKPAKPQDEQTMQSASGSDGPPETIDESTSSGVDEEELSPDDDSEDSQLTDLSEAERTEREELEHAPAGPLADFDDPETQSSELPEGVKDNETEQSPAEIDNEQRALTEPPSSHSGETHAPSGAAVVAPLPLDEDPVSAEATTGLDDIDALLVQQLKEPLQLLKTLVSRQDILESLQSENQAYRKDVIAKAVRPLVNEIVTLHHNTSRQLDGLKKREEAISLEELEKIITGFLRDLEYALEDSGIDKFELANSGEAFDPTRQTMVGEKPTDDPDLDGTVAELARPGFSMDGKIIQKQRVRLYRLPKEKA